MVSGRRTCADWTRRAFALAASAVMIGATGGGSSLGGLPTLPVTGPPVRTLTAIGLTALLLGTGLLLLSHFCKPGPGPSATAGDIDTGRATDADAADVEAAETRSEKLPEPGLAEPAPAEVTE